MIDPTPVRHPYDVVDDVLTCATRPLTVDEIARLARIQRVRVLYVLVQLLEAGRATVDAQRRWSRRWLA